MILLYHVVPGVIWVVHLRTIITEELLGLRANYRGTFRRSFADRMLRKSGLFCKM